ncbi:MAG TPA: methyltransferase domain-containing protein [Thermoplasmata archaeon]|nr:methyltransferase domain-containing protein [Thermoplasmata archaeon]
MEFAKTPLPIPPKVGPLQRPLSMKVMKHDGWARDAEDVRRRYRHLAAIYPIFEVLLGLPLGARSKTADRLGLAEGARVLEVGCGTGRNLPHLVKRVGRSGRVYGVDVTPEMIEVANRTCAKEEWSNVVLIEGDAEQVELPEPIDAVLFSLCYGVIPNHFAALRNVWRQLRPGGRVVVLDGTLGAGNGWDVLRPLITSFSRRTVLGNPAKRPWEDLREIAGNVAKEELWPGIYYICWATRNTGV